MTLPEVIPSIQLAVGLVFAYAGAQKLRSFDRVVAKVSEFTLLPKCLAPTAAMLLIASELFVATTHLLNLGIAIAAPATIWLLATFVVATGWILIRGASVPCLCFGASDGDVVSARTMARLIALTAAEAMVCFHAGALADWRTLAIGIEDWLTWLALAILWVVSVSWLIALPDVKYMVIASAGRRVGRRASMK